MLRPKLLFAALLVLTTGRAQDPLWIANRTSSDMVRLSPCGSLEATVALGVSVRSVHQAPDGNLWVVRFGSANFDIYDASGSLITSPGFAFGSPYALEFDRQGHAWIAGGSGVEEFDASGTSVNTYPLSDPAPLGITVDADGNKWIAHRFGPPGSVSRIDAVTGNVTSHPMPSTSLILPTTVTADHRGVLMPSHIWVVGDNRGAAELIELDAAGNVVNTHFVGPAGGALGSLATDVNGHVWTGDFRNGALYEFDPVSMTAINTYFIISTVNGLAFGPYGRLWVTARNTPAELQRVDASNGNVEVIQRIGDGTQSSMSALHHYALVVDPMGDLDGDSVPNVAEITQGSSYLDPSSNAFTSLGSTGITATGQGGTIAIQAAAGTSSVVIFSSALSSPGLTIPPIVGTLDLDLLGVVPASLNFSGSGSVNYPIPASVTLVGATVWTQGLTGGGATLQFTNVACSHIWN
ncbi:MAG: hypothetical protein H6833_08020 [Planctomycetes bacterium]|nr:hypothetical protein [Planctomycetota bacterium]